MRFTVATALSTQRRAYGGSEAIPNGFQGTQVHKLFEKRSEICNLSATKTAGSSLIVSMTNDIHCFIPSQRRTHPICYLESIEFLCQHVIAFSSVSLMFHSMPVSIRPSRFQHGNLLPKASPLKTLQLQV